MCDDETGLELWFAAMAFSPRLWPAGPLKTEADARPSDLAFSGPCFPRFHPLDAGYRGVYCPPWHL